ncbi:hypothetical protein E4T39_01333 [Aureobasidium subglaciale]|nr:hypothetical protein E4T39_01333 [Aureobasidium subglaciale]
MLLPTYPLTFLFPKEQKKPRLLWKETGSLRVLLLRLTCDMRKYQPVRRIELRPRVIDVCPLQPSRPHTSGEKAGAKLRGKRGIRS